MIWDRMLAGMCAGAWVIGFIVALGLFIAVIAAFIALMGWAFSDEGEVIEDDAPDSADAGAAAPGCVPLHRPRGAGSGKNGKE